MFSKGKIDEYKLSKVERILFSAPELITEVPKVKKVKRKGNLAWRIFNNQYQMSAPLAPSDIANLPKLESLKLLKLIPFLNSSKKVVTNIGKKINKNKFDDLITNFVIKSTIFKLVGKIEVAKSLKFFAKSCPLLLRTMIRNGTESKK